MKNLVKEFAEITVQFQPDVEDSHEFLLVVSVNLPSILAAENILVALVVDMVVAVTAFSVRLVVRYTTSNDGYAIHDQISFLWSPI